MSQVTTPGGVEGDGTGTANEVTIWATADTLKGEAGLTYSGSTLTLSNRLDIGDLGAAGVIENTNTNQNILMEVNGTGLVEVENQTTNNPTTFQVRGNGTGAPIITMTNDTKAASLEVNVNNEMTIAGGTDSFKFDVSSATGGITWPDGTTQITAATGLAAGTVTGTIMKWSGSAWIETTSATGQILVSADNELTIDDGTTSTADIVLSANNGATNPAITLTGNGGFPKFEIKTLSSTTYGISNTFGALSMWSQSSALAIGSGGRGSLQFPGYTGMIVQSAQKSANNSGEIGVVTLPKDFLFNNQLPTFYTERTNNAEGRVATWTGLDTYAIAETDNNVSDSVYIDLGASAPDQQTYTASWPFYRFDVYYVNTTDGTNEHMHVELIHDGTTIADTEYGWIGTTTSRELQYVTRYNGGTLEIGLWSATTSKAVKFYLRAVSGFGMA
jgi:hypothetical protein